MKKTFIGIDSIKPKIQLDTIVCHMDWLTAGET